MRHDTGRANDIAQFYDLLDRLEAGVGGTRVLAECNGRMNWPRRGVYFFFEGGEAWARQVLSQFEPHLDGVCTVVFLAGKKYRECENA